MRKRSREAALGRFFDRTSFAKLRELFERAQRAKEYARHNPPMESYEAFRTDVSRFDRNVRYAHNEFTFPQAKYAFRRTASALALSIRRKEP